RTPSYDRDRDPPALSDSRARSQPTVRDDERDRPPVGPSSADAHERAGERLQLHATERRLVGREPRAREGPDNRSPSRGKQTHGEADPQYAPRRPPRRRPPSPHPRLRQPPRHP